MTAAVPLSTDHHDDLYDCPCPRSAQELRQRQEWHGGKVRIKYQYQCTTCGRGHGLYARQPLSDDLPLWDNSLPYSNDVELDGHDERTWWISYHEYLNSPQWEDKRKRVREREVMVQGIADPLCEACYRRVGVQAHHSTYRHLRAEPLYELRWLCQLCHDHLHNRMGMRD